MQKLPKKYRSFFISLAITGVLAAFSFLFYYPSHSDLGKGFSVAIIYMLVRYAALYAGILVLLTRLARLLKKTEGILYILPGTINFLVGALCVILYSMGEADRPWLHKCLLNLLMGTLILADAFLLNREIDTGGSEK